MATKPLVIPTVFASEGTGTLNNIPLLDADFATLASYFNDGSFCNTRGSDSGTVNNYVVTLPSGYVPSAYNQAMRLVFNPLNGNTGPATINVNGLGSQMITTASGSALSGGEIVANQDCDLIYDGTNFRILGAPLSQIWSVRLRSYNALGNSNFETDQRNAHFTIANPGINIFLADRWALTKSAITGTVNTQTYGLSGSTPVAPVLIPNTSYCITRGGLRINLTAKQTTLAAGDFFGIVQQVEGAMWRELSQDVSSLSLLVYSNVASLKFAVSIRSPDLTQSLVKMCTTGAVGFSLVQLPNIPKPTAGNFSSLPGVVGYTLTVALACGTTYIAPATDTWQAGNYMGASGMANWLASPTPGTDFYLLAIQHEPGALCSQFMDLDFQTNLSRCQRYYTKSYPYGQKAGTSSSDGMRVLTCCPTLTTILQGSCPFPVVMAKYPTVTPYSYLGTVNAVTLIGTTTDVGLVSGSGIQMLADSGFGGVTAAAAQTANNQFGTEYIADTGW